MRKKASFLFTVLAVMLGFMLIVLLYNVQLYKLRQGAAQTLIDVAENNLDADRSLPGYYILHTGDDKNDLSDDENKLISSYLKNQSRISYGHVHKFQSGDVFFYYIVISKKADGYPSFFSGNGTPLIYVDVSFEKKLLDDTTMLLSMVMVTFSAILIFAGLFVSRIYKKNEESKRIFFENASHELKTPLTAIEGYTEGISENIIDMDSGCRTILHETSRMRDLINSILEMSKLDSGMVRCSMKENDIREIVYSCVSSLLPSATAKGIRIKMNMDRPVFAECDESMLYSALSNIIANGIRYASALMNISAETSEDNVIITIYNDGTAMTRDELHHVFDRFYKGTAGQTGIGMALAREYILLHSGSIEASSEGGCTFRIRIPQKHGSIASGRKK